MHSFGEWSKQNQKFANLQLTESENLQKLENDQKSRKFEDWFLKKMTKIAHKFGIEFDDGIENVPVRKYVKEPISGIW